MRRGNLIFPLLITAMVCGCAGMVSDMDRGRPGYKIMGISEDPTYGYSQENPILVGNVREYGMQPEYDYMKALRGPDNQSLTYKRLGSCCPFETEASPWGGGRLDIWEITYEGLDEPVHIYLNPYHYNRPMAPMGFTHVDYWLDKESL